MNNHPFHMVDKSPWPLIMSMNMMSLLTSLSMFFMKSDTKMLIMSLMITTMSIYQWWRDVIRESTMQGMHTIKVMLNIKLGMIMFIISEVLFFMSLFWAFFHSSLSPSIEIGMNWPPNNIKSLNPMSIPMLNTCILISSGLSITWSHWSLLSNNKTQLIKSMLITILLGIYFTMIQILEYWEMTFTMSDSVFGSLFFLSTGFHGLHVLIGTVFIYISMNRSINLHFSSNHHAGFECSVWYWHFVDVVWLFLFTMMYWWGN